MHENQGMTKFQYVILRRDGGGRWIVEPHMERVGEPGASMADVLNLLGDIGFELVSVLDGGTYILKRADEDAQA